MDVSPCALAPAREKREKEREKGREGEKERGRERRGWEALLPTPFR